MNKTLTLLATAAAALTFTARPAAALGDKEAAILGGVIGGLVIGAAIDDALDHDGSVAVDIAYAHRDRDRHGDRGRDWDRGRDHGRDRDYGRHDHDRRGDHHYDRGDRHHDRGGYWTYRTVRVWVPKRVYFTYDRWGNRIKHFERGHWTYHREKVWVSGRGRW